VGFERITIDPAQMGGQPCIRGLRMPVATVVAMVADGMTADEIVGEHPDLEVEEVAEALRYAAEAVRERELLAVLSDGWTNLQIATRTGISENTVKYHLKNLYDKLDVRNRAMAVALYSSEKGRSTKSSSG